MWLRTTLSVVFIGFLLALKPDGTPTYAKSASLTTYLALDTMHVFPANGANGANPSSLFATATGTVYGTTISGGNGGFGTFYKMTVGGTYSSPSSTVTVLHHFQDGSIYDDGTYCTGRLVQDAGGYIYGTCQGDNDGTGLVYQIDTASGALTILHHFTDDANWPDDGWSPMGLAIDAGDTLYGVTQTGGWSCYCNGVIYKLEPDGMGGYTYSIIYNFNVGNNSGDTPMGMVRGSDGKLYGTTYFGGANGWGVVWRFNPATNVYTKLADLPAHGLDTDFSGDLVQISSTYTGGKMEFWGSTHAGGTYNKGYTYKIVETSAGSGSFNFSVQHHYNNGTNEGYEPSSEIVFVADTGLWGGARIYGLTRFGGQSGSGQFYEYQYDFGNYFWEPPNSPGAWIGGQPDGVPVRMVEGFMGATSVLYGISHYEGINGNTHGTGNGFIWRVYRY